MSARQPISPTVLQPVPSNVQRLRPQPSAQPFAILRRGSGLLRLDAARRSSELLQGPLPPQAA
jgi:hypothetical protein